MYCGGEVVEALGALAGRKKAAELEKVEKRKESEVSKAAKQKADLAAIRAKLVAKQEPTKVEKILLVVLGRRHLGMGEDDLSVLKASMKVAHAQVHIAEYTKLMGELGGSFPWDVFCVPAVVGGGGGAAAPVSPGGGAAATPASPGGGGCGGGGGGRTTSTGDEGNNEDTGRATKRPRNRRTQPEDSDSEEEEDDDDDESGAEESDEDEILDRENKTGESDDEEGDEGEDEYHFVGRHVQKDFGKHGVWRGTVMKVDVDGFFLDTVRRRRRGRAGR
jgi:hypothetical protein